MRPRSAEAIPRSSMKLAELFDRYMGSRSTTDLGGRVQSCSFLPVQCCMCKRGFGSPRIWIPHPKTLADLDDPKRGFGSPADLDPSIYFVCDRLENDEVEFWEPNPRTNKRGFGSPRIWIPIPKES